MQIDLGNALSEVASPGVSEDTLLRLDKRVAIAHERIDEGRTAGEYGYAALALPETTDTDQIRTTIEPFLDSRAVLTVGIGGSALGAMTLANGLASPIDAYALDNVDPLQTTELLSNLPLEETAVHIVSRSGMTVETLANFLVVREVMTQSGVDWTERTFVTTGPDGHLRRLAEQHGLPALDAPVGVPGRFAVFSTVGLPVAVLCGHDIDAILAGARTEADRLTGSLFESPAYAYGAIAYALSVRGAAVNVMMPYAESLETFAEWFSQLWAESLGKEELGQVPVRALGATDQHSQLQLLRAGPRNALVTFVRPTERKPHRIPNSDLDDIDYLHGLEMGDLIDAEFTATEASLALAGRPNVRIEIDRVDEKGLGELLFGMEAACMLAGELHDIETFVQPAVEWAKGVTRGLLGGESDIEVRDVLDKRQLLVPPDRA